MIDLAPFQGKLVRIIIVRSKGIRVFEGTLRKINLHQIFLECESHRKSSRIEGGIWLPRPTSRDTIELIGE
jgi:hypothetical protein